MADHIDASEATPIYAALVRELADPEIVSQGVAGPPKFADELADRVFSGASGFSVRKTHSRPSPKNTKRRKKRGRKAISA